METITSYLTAHAPHVLWGLVIFVAGRYLSKALIRLARSLMTKAQVDPTLVSFACNVAHVLFMILVIITALGQLGVQTTSLVAILGAAGLAIGLSLQNSLGNLASGVMIISFRPFKVGDVIEAAGTKGKVHELNIFTTILKTDDGKTVIIPNASLTNGIITNHN